MTWQLMWQWWHHHNIHNSKMGLNWANCFTNSLFYSSHSALPEFAKFKPTYYKIHYNLWYFIKLQSHDTRNFNKLQSPDHIHAHNKSSGTFTITQHEAHIHFWSSIRSSNFTSNSTCYLISSWTHILL
jgi:hypothetical protein